MWRGAGEHVHGIQDLSCCKTQNSNSAWLGLDRRLYAPRSPTLKGCSGPPTGPCPGLCLSCALASLSPSPFFLCQEQSHQCLGCSLSQEEGRAQLHTGVRSPDHVDLGRGRSKEQGWGTLAGETNDAMT